MSQTVNSFADAIEVAKQTIRAKPNVEGVGVPYEISVTEFFGTDYEVEGNSYDVFKELLSAFIQFEFNHADADKNSEMHKTDTKRIGRFKQMVQKEFDEFFAEDALAADPLFHYIFNFDGPQMKVTVEVNDFIIGIVLIA